jgi:non-heme chloroperoxidase
MPYVETRNRARLFYEDWGTGRPVLLIHGWPLNADMWEYQMPVLAAAGFRCIAVDRRGFGRSDQPGQGYDFDTFADDLAEVLTTSISVRSPWSATRWVVARSRAISRAAAQVALVGAALASMDEGMAAMMSQMIAADRPQFMSDGVPTLFAAAAGASGSVASAGKPGSVGSAADPVFVGPTGEPVSAAQMQWVVGLALQASPLATLACLRALGQVDFRHELGAFTMPTLVIHGDADTSQPITVARAVAEAIPGARLVEYAGAPHGLFLTERTRLAADLLRFAQEVQC